MQEILEQLPPATQNNARSIVRKKLERLEKYPSERLAQEIEDLLNKLGINIVVDWSDADYGEGPKQ